MNDFDSPSSIRHRRSSISLVTQILDLLLVHPEVVGNFV